MSKKNVNSELIAHLKGRLGEASSSHDEKNKRHDQEGRTVEMSSGLHQLMGFFEDKLSDPDFATSSIDLSRKKRMYAIFEQSVQKSLVSTKRSRRYEDFPDLAVLYFLRDADESGFTVEEIESVVKELKFDGDE